MKQQVAVKKEIECGRGSQGKATKRETMDICAAWQAIYTVQVSRLLTFIFMNTAL